MGGVRSTLRTFFCVLLCFWQRAWEGYALLYTLFFVYCRVFGFWFLDFGLWLFFLASCSLSLAMCIRGVCCCLLRMYKRAFVCVHIHWANQVDTRVHIRRCIHLLHALVRTQHANTYSWVHSLSHTHTHSLSLTHTHTNTHTHTHTHTCTHTHTHTRTHAHTCTQSHIHTRIHTHAHIGGSEAKQNLRLWHSRNTHTGFWMNAEKTQQDVVNLHI